MKSVRSSMWEIKSLLDKVQKILGGIGMEGLPELISALKLWLFLTPIPYALALIILIAVIIGIVKGIKRMSHRVVHSEEYRRIPLNERRDEIRNVLKEGRDYFL